MTGMALARALRRHWPTALVVSLLVAGAASYAAGTSTTQYSSTSIAAIQPGDVRASPSSIEYLLPSVQARLQSAPVAAEVQQSLPKTLQDVPWGFASQVSPGSGVMRLTATSSDERLPVLVSNAYAEQLTQLRLSKLPVEVTILAPAIDAVGSSQRYKIIVSGFTLAVICGLLSALGRLAWD